ncbi:putative hydroxypyruvate reductase [Pseudovibrio sp. Ad46]|uniref:glycerate kinase type-2 family protein n=1 Tax=unclassified Pseudovibrio TaxID=2627060 RepID=UPI0007AEC137|nr:MULTISPECIES: glycerate kinase [unclassified Pseudovibrio]KZK88828.1 putative hydroxypyruvate reductase [Pseudovibrio sp. Ad5]KZK95748.1 putative hydroxypyruvate reductase [Pseudovibrio sp. Ad46]KZL25176.1 putative hydroxypyruvate reductase [Pseudovibrio sp. WM33]
MAVDPKRFLSGLFHAAIESAQPEKCIPKFLPDTPKGRLIVIGAGKASAAMARAVEDNWQGDLSGLVITRYGYNVPCKSIEIIEAAHPVPDDAGLAGAKRMLKLVSDLSADDTVLCLISGGGSSLLPLPFEGLSLEDKQCINKELLRCGATISEMNCVRRHLSQIKGGRLAAACHPAKVINLLISDVPGDDPINIASGPTVADPTTCADAMAIVERYKIGLPVRALEVLESGVGETPDKSDLHLGSVETHMIATPQLALEAAASVAEKQGVPAYILGDSVEGEATDVGIVMAGIAKQVASHGQPFKAPCVLLSGGETTVTLKGNGRGGRNVEFLLSLAVALDGQQGVYALAGDTDGVDGIEEIAGAYCDPSTLQRAWGKEINPRLSLADNDGHGFFEAIGDSVITGPTLTNVNDFRAILIR